MRIMGSFHPSKEQHMEPKVGRTTEKIAGNMPMDKICVQGGWRLVVTETKYFKSAQNTYANMNLLERENRKLVI